MNGWIAVQGRGAKTHRAPFISGGAGWVVGRCDFGRVNCFVVLHAHTLAGGVTLCKLCCNVEIQVLCTRKKTVRCTTF